MKFVAIPNSNSQNALDDEGRPFGSIIKGNDGAVYIHMIRTVTAVQMQKILKFALEYKGNQ